MSFYEDLEIGREAEAIAWDILSHEPCVRSIIDIRLDKRFQDWDVDLMFENSERQFRYVEVKGDKRMHETGNIAVETLSSQKYDGWLIKSKADYLFYYDMVRKIMYCMPMQKLKEYINQTNPKQVRISYDSDGYLLNVNDLIENKVIDRYWEGAG